MREGMIGNVQLVDRAFYDALLDSSSFKESFKPNWLGQDVDVVSQNPVTNMETNNIESSHLIEGNGENAAEKITRIINDTESMSQILKKVPGSRGPITAKWGSLAALAAIESQQVQSRMPSAVKGEFKRLPMSLPWNQYTFWLDKLAK